MIFGRRRESETFLSQQKNKVSNVKISNVITCPKSNHPKKNWNRLERKDKSVSWKIGKSVGNSRIILECEKLIH